MSVESDFFSTVDNLGGVMMKALLAMMVTGACALGSQAIADDTGSPTMMQKHRMMNECMRKQMGSQMGMNMGMSKADAKKICKDQLKTPKDPTATVGTGGPPSAPVSH
jgi:hypothetical protein